MLNTFKRATSRISLEDMLQKRCTFSKNSLLFFFGGTCQAESQIYIEEQLPKNNQDIHKEP